ncbi:fluoride efflux transporter FluC [Halobium salinum]|uniref:Fluoride-specific ion channel FluC n=1 Tax=Halobium salinum TaxID=1364940 RepID=A0ABD5PBX1_9EURY|nr:CrcB family protein [Halobium salinum]
MTTPPTEALSAVVLVGLGGAAGAVSRYLLGQIVAGRRATLAVNVLGSALLGIVVAAGPALGGPTTLAVGTGFCGAFTTFSSFAVGVVELATEDRRADAAEFAAVNLLAALGGVGLGSALIAL